METALSSGNIGDVCQILDRMKTMKSDAVIPVVPELLLNQLLFHTIVPAANAMGHVVKTNTSAGLEVEGEMSLAVSNQDHIL